MLKSRTNAPDEPPYTLATLRQQVIDQESAVRAADVAFDQAERAAKLSPGNEANITLEATLQAARAARRHLTALQGQLKEAERRSSAAFVGAWKEAEPLLRRRAAVAERIQKHGGELYADYVEWKDINAQLRGLGIMPDETGAMISGLDTVAAFKLELARAGFSWAAQTGFLLPADIPPFSQRVAAANAHALKQRGQ